jgi:hypothetical protein
MLGCIPSYYAFKGHKMEAKCEGHTCFNFIHIFSITLRLFIFLVFDILYS